MSNVNDLVLESFLNHPLDYYVGHALRGAGDTLTNISPFAIYGGAVPFVAGLPGLMPHHTLFQPPLPVDGATMASLIGGSAMGAGVAANHLGDYLYRKGNKMLAKYNYGKPVAQPEVSNSSNVNLSPSAALPVAAQSNV